MNIEDGEKAEQEEQDRLKSGIEENYRQDQEALDFLEEDMVIFQVLDGETGEITEMTEMTMDAQSYKYFCEMENEYERQQEARRAYRRKHEWDGWRSRVDD
jgi:hypothetical protein